MKFPTMKFKIIASLLAAGLLYAGSLVVSAADSAAPRVIKIRAGVENAMKFDLAIITAAPGESLKVVLTNACVLPKAVMGHNWVLLKAGADTTAFANAAASESAKDYIPEQQKEKIVAFVKLLGPNETGEVTFHAPTAPGEYPFICTFPAHCAIGMKGVLVVKK